MKLHLANTPGQNIFTGYGEGYVMLNDIRHENNLIVMPDRLIRNWEAADFKSLTEAHFEFILGLGPELILLGTGPTLRFPPARLFQCLVNAQVGMEVMDTHAACRTFNILAAEGRRVAAALLL